MPAKEPKGGQRIAEKETKKPNAVSAAKAYDEAQRKKRQSSAARNRTASVASKGENKAEAEETKSIAKAANATGSKVFSKPKLSSSKGVRNSTQMAST